MTKENFLIPVKRSTAKEIKRRRIFRLETYDEIIQRLLDKVKK